MADKASSRRDFLRGKAAAAAMQETVDRRLPPTAEAKTRAASQPQHLTMALTRRAMACEFQIRLRVSQDQNETDAGMRALDVIEDVEQQLSVYRETSDVSRLNLLAGEQPLRVEDDFGELLRQSLTLCESSGGAYDITAGPLSDVWGFTRRAGELPAQQQIKKALKRVDWRSVQYDVDKGTVFLEGGVAINFNSIGKGYALDRALASLLAEGVENSLLHGGRSTLLARGSRQAEEGWQVGVRHPLRPKERIAAFTLRDEAFSTSGSATQCFVHNGKRYGHLIDPRTGWPAEGLHSVSVIAPTGAEADALSTAFFVMGYDAAARWCENRPDVRSLFVCPGENRDEVVLRTLNLEGPAESD